MNDVFVILTWQELYVKDVMLAVNDTGRVMLCSSYAEAQEYAENNLHFSWKIVEIDL